MVTLALSILFMVAGFSQIQIGGVKPSDIIISISFLILILYGKLSLGVAFIFFLISFIYAWLIGGLLDFKTLISNFIIFSIIFSLINYLKNSNITEIEYYLRLFVYSMFVSNRIALIFFLFLPQFKESVIDISSIGVRFKGFFTQANGYAYVLLLNFPIALYFLKSRKNFFNIVNVLLIISCIIMAQSRGAVLSLLMGIIIVYLIYLYRTRKIKKIIAPLILVCIVGFSALTILPNILEENFGINLSRLNPSAEKASERNISDLGISSIKEDRFYLINAGLETIQTYPFGLGFQPQHIIIGNLTGVYLIPHNYYLTLLLTYGVVVGFFWLFIIGYLIYSGLKVIYKEKVSPDNLFFYLTAMMLMVGIFYLTHSSDWSYFYFLVAFYIVMLKNQNSRNIKQ